MVSAFKQSLWPRTGDSAFYNGLLFGYFGRIIDVTADGWAQMYNSTGIIVTSDQWQWDDQNHRWWVDLKQHRPTVRNRE